MKHHGGKIPWKAFVVSCLRQGKHLVCDDKFPEIYDFQWTSDGWGNAVWFDTEDEAKAFVEKHFPVTKRKKGCPEEDRCLTLIAEYIYREFYYRLGRHKGKIVVIDEVSGEIVDNNVGHGYNTEDEAWEAFGHRFFGLSENRPAWQGESF